MQCIIIPISVLLITGGYNSNERTTVEVVSPSGVRHSCSVPPLPEPRWDHTQDGAVACGGGDPGSATLTTCDTLTASGWITSQHLVERRNGHVSWSSPAGLLLMGGHSNLTTELLTNTDSSSSPSFSLEYYTE